MNNIIRNLHIRNFRSLERASILDCGSLNVLIGKNNAGKSSALIAIPMLFEHLSAGRIVSSWRTDRYPEQFTHRERERVLQFGVELSLSESTKANLCEELRSTAPHLTKSIDQLSTEASISFILRFEYDGRLAYQYIESISVGGIDNSKDLLAPASTVLLTTPSLSARQLFQNYQDGETLRQKISTIQRLVDSDRFPLSAYFSDKRSVPARYLIDQVFAEDQVNNPALRRDVANLLEKSETLESLRAKASGEIALAADEIDRIAKTEIETPLTTYTGEVRVQPPYIGDLCKAFGATPILRLGERKQPIGRKEASRLLQLKVKRGGPERLQVVQQTVRALLGVSLDAFQGDGGRESAEIDVDNFLAEANGAGIRESLRLILDLELEPCDIVLVEEPEVHLHPGLEFAVHSYLQEKGKTKQFFVTTHSTNFVDTVSPQNIYLISRNARGVATCDRLAEGDAPVKLPAELGIRLSTVFMFDRIVFVEGPSDESVLRELSRTEGLDLNSAGVAFIHMGGVSNFAHYAAQATLDLLSRRRVQMWFIVDRDERDEAETRKMVNRLGDKATMFVLQRRELENFLIDESAVRGFVGQKLGKAPPSPEEYTAAMAKVAGSILEEVVTMYLEKRCLPPIYLRGQDASGDISERLNVAITALQDRLGQVTSERERIGKELTVGWGVEKAIQVAPGALLLDRLCKELGCTFQKQRGDSVKLARHLPAKSVPDQIRSILRSIST